MIKGKKAGQGDIGRRLVFISLRSGQRGARGEGSSKTRKGEKREQLGSLQKDKPSK